jgi:hypothetical protein
MQIIFLFTTGRTGTGFLSQCFGKRKWSKRGIGLNQGIAVTHELWSDMPIEELKCAGIYSDEGVDIGGEYIRRKLKELPSEANGLFITDHKIGRYFCPAILQINVDFKVIYVKRDPMKVALSFKAKQDSKERDLDTERFLRYKRRMWEANKNSPNDKFVIGKVTDREWNSYSDLYKFEWYANEVGRQWEVAKPLISDDSYIEIIFDDFINKCQLDMISDFINLDYDESMVNVLANESLK